MSKMNPAEFQALIERDLPLGRMLGFRALELADGKARVGMAFSPAFVRSGGTIAGPLMMALADCAMYAAVLSAVGGAVMAVTSNLTIHFLRAPRPVGLVAEAALLRLGRRLAVIEVTLYSEGDPKPVAHVTGTYALPGERGREGAAVP